ncbi:Uridine phosphorylase [Rhizobiales bacterium GAS191]|nr:Uridine phosphorylase [Rhizobiales bacterium GAS191]
MQDTPVSPLLQHKWHRQPSVFSPEALLREARRQKGLAQAEVPATCLLDPDGDIVRRLRDRGECRMSKTWPCYHSELDVFTLQGRDIGIVGRAVGAPYAVLVAEQLFSTGCKLLISLTSAGQITTVGAAPYFVLIDRALRDEGTSHHYLPPAEFADADPLLIARSREALDKAGLQVHVGASWTTDAPFRETARAIDAAKSRSILAVEMEAAALYALAQARGEAVLCFAHVTNAMGQHGEDFEKGVEDGTADALRLMSAIVQGLA